MRDGTICISPPKEYRAAEIREIRVGLGMTQVVFAEIMGVSLKTVEAWEAGRNRPEGPARRILEILQRKPTVLDKVMHAE